MADKFLIDVTDARFLIPENDDVIDFIRRVNPFAHSDVGTVLFDLAKQIGASAYCPAPRSCAYVVLHTPTNRIFGIAYDQRGLALRLTGAALAEALEGAGVAMPAVGEHWVRFAPWASAHAPGVNPQLRGWAERSYALAAAE